MNEACINEAIKDTTVWIYVLKQHASDKPENCNKITVEPLMSHGLFYQCPHTFLGLGTFLLHCSLWRARKLADFIKNILICVLKMNEGLTGLEQHEG